MREARRVNFMKDIKVMMYGYGDVVAPRYDTAEALHGYVLDYMSILLTNTHNMAQVKGKTKTEDLLYYLKRDRKKYSRVRHLLITNEEIKLAKKAFEPKDYEKE
ncbi:TRANSCRIPTION INITIATION FACTOR TFIID [Encephalitozoon cuniculi GB-M1]|uniref:Transcription initiation factor TFIID subunit 13 n=2 Tax=Encephalitozoon cuniculi TaxID=6035 RepID=Q8SS37_ENCCU|nr:transcription initiation factor TFIID subunit TAF13 [Encephalitozoon cuniculi GB-M1]AGE95341.1 transcription initiation factor tfIId [Encephalitozoon cuniculi]KMV66298.1 transcription initiation factor TFIID subunitTAF13 [Encephalitozoon cuniculi EcunIII-L]UYI27475.1 transcription initiation factor TFIID subunit TAF13 [Encephalitozoon cuniculi]CAD25282.1 TRANSCRIPTION INITIATION FACTOR TFIID [Encephalitozoon cuniculi GB-M1]